MNSKIEPRSLLIRMLQEAAQLEHCLLDAYLFTACSLKSTPQEFLTVGGKENRRRAVQFELVRQWKQSMLNVAHEEMLHLHYVQCMLRALGESPSFGLPERNPVNGNWIIPNWRMRLGDEPLNGDKGIEVPVAPLTIGNIRNFVLYESTDALQDQNPFGKEAMKLFNRLYLFELSIRFESMLLHVQDAKHRSELKVKLNHIYTRLTSFDMSDKLTSQTITTATTELETPPLSDIRFQSIADFYKNGILPIYQQAFDFGWVKHNNRDLNNEFLDPNYAGEGFLPIGPIHRGKRFDQFAQNNSTNPIRNYKNVRDIINEITEEGEGFTNFDMGAHTLLEVVEKPEGARTYLQALLNPKAATPELRAAVEQGELLRQSHLYRFAMIMVALQEEMRLAKECDAEFEPSRAPLPAANPLLQSITDDLPAQFNACYLVMLAWLSRIYEIPEWMSDKPRRNSIEMLATGPLMSLAIRPFLELASFFPIKQSALFRIDRASLPNLPIHAQQLLELYSHPERSEEINQRIDYLAVRVLTDAASWADRQKEALSNDTLPIQGKDMIVSRLCALSHLREFQRQLPFREHGGYSNRLPDLTYQQSHKDGLRFAEGPTIPNSSDSHNPIPLFENTLALRLKFSGWGLVQLATDPDPPTDEVGCSGTHMLHSADGDLKLNRALVWQAGNGKGIILREPRALLPEIGVSCTDVALVLANGPISSGYTPLQIMQSTGAIQTSGVQQVLSIQGFSDLLSLTPKEILGADRQIRVDLRAKNGIKPFLIGDNHLVWQDGEPIDPFVLAISADSASVDSSLTKSILLFQREVFNDNQTFLQMSPLQRLMSCRAPCGFDFDFSHIPSGSMSEAMHGKISDSNFPMSYLLDRAISLSGSLDKSLEILPKTQGDVDKAVSLAERMMLVSIPRRTTVAWLNILLHYGHSLSGPLALGTGANPILDAIAQHTHLPLELVRVEDRNISNSRWLLKYTLGIMDTDALSHFVFGELYLPVAIQPSEKPIEFSRRWTFSAAIKAALADYACQFRKPFWAPFTVDGNQRSVAMKDGTIITESLQRQTSDGYTYSMNPISGISMYTGVVRLLSEAQSPEVVELEWRYSFQYTDTSKAIALLCYTASVAQQMEACLSKIFAPKPSNS